MIRTRRTMRAREADVLRMMHVVATSETEEVKNALMEILYRRQLTKNQALGLMEQVASELRRLDECKTQCFTPST